VEVWGYLHECYHRAMTQGRKDFMCNIGETGQSNVAIGTGSHGERLRQRARATRYVSS